jgi:glycosyltransferase involved in cell wall biosynthesis
VVSAALAPADLVALPYRDGASLRRGTLMAALAHGCAIVTTEPVDPLIAGAVAVVPADDPAALAGRLAELGDDPAGRAALGRAAAAAAAAFGWEPIAALTLDVYAAALARRRGRRA